MVTMASAQLHPDDADVLARTYGRDVLRRWLAAGLATSQGGRPLEQLSPLRLPVWERGLDAAVVLARALDGADSHRFGRRAVLLAADAIHPGRNRALGEVLGDGYQLASDAGVLTPPVEPVALRLACLLAGAHGTSGEPDGYAELSGRPELVHLRPSNAGTLLLVLTDRVSAHTLDGAARQVVEAFAASFPPVGAGWTPVWVVVGDRLGAAARRSLDPAVLVTELGARRRGAWLYEVAVPDNHRHAIVTLAGPGRAVPAVGGVPDPVAATCEALWLARDEGDLAAAYADALRLARPGPQP